MIILKIRGFIQPPNSFWSWDAPVNILNLDVGHTKLNESNS